MWQLFVTLMSWVRVWLDCFQIDSEWTGEWPVESEPEWVFFIKRFSIYKCWSRICFEWIFLSKAVTLNIHQQKLVILPCQTIDWKKTKFIHFPHALLKEKLSINAPLDKFYVISILVDSQKYGGQMSVAVKSHAVKCHFQSNIPQSIVPRSNVSCCQMSRVKCPTVKCQLLSNGQWSIALNVTILSKAVILNIHQ